MAAKTATAHPTDAEGAPTPEVEKLAAAEAEETTADESALPHVHYLGDAGVREISTADWKAAGVENQKTVTWSDENEYRVPVSELNDQALEVIKRDRNLKIK